MIAFRPVASSAKKCTSSCASKSGSPQGVVITAQTIHHRRKKMGRSRGLEPPTLGTTNRCSNQLSYDRHGEQRSGSFGRARHLRGMVREGKDGRSSIMNATMEKFGHPGTLLLELDHWVVLLRPAQVTLGSLVLAAKSDANAYADLSSAAFAEQKYVIGAI